MEETLTKEQGTKMATAERYFEKNILVKEKSISPKNYIEKISPHNHFKEDFEQVRKPLNSKK